MMIIGFQNCLSRPACGKGYVGDGQCNYQSIGMVPDRNCDYIAFEKEVSELLNSKCSNSTYVGFFTYCNNLLKDSYPIAARCECSPTLTTVVRSIKTSSHLSEELTSRCLYRLRRLEGWGTTWTFGKYEMFSFNFSFKFSLSRDENKSNVHYGTKNIRTMFFLLFVLEFYRINRSE